MSPFANSPHLWLTAHLHRIHCKEHLVKIQALVRGYLVRRQQQKERKLKAITNDILRSLAQPRESVALVPLMRRLGLHVWADTLPSAEECIQN